MASLIGVPYVYGGGRPISMANALKGTDCSGAVCAAWEAAYPGSTGGAYYTGDMRELFLSTGLWEWVPTDSSYTGGAREGDVWLRHHGDSKDHTAMDDGQGHLYEETPPQGRMTDFYWWGWDGYLHWVGLGSGDVPSEPILPDTERDAVDIEGEFPMTLTCQVENLNVRTEPSTSSEVVATYHEGETVSIDRMLYEGGYVWASYVGGSGNRRYVAVCSCGETYLS